MMHATFRSALLITLIGLTVLAGVVMAQEMGNYVDVPTVDLIVENARLTTENVALQAKVAGLTTLMDRCMSLVHNFARKAVHNEISKPSVDRVMGQEIPLL